jgi:hypothetical protein
VRTCVWVEGIGAEFNLAQEGCFLAIEFFFGEGAVVPQLLELA